MFKYCADGQKLTNAHHSYIFQNVALAGRLHTRKNIVAHMTGYSLLTRNYIHAGVR